MPEFRHATSRARKEKRDWRPSLDTSRRSKVGDVSFFLKHFVTCCGVENYGSKTVQDIVWQVVDWI